MKADGGTLLTLVAHFALLSLLAVGGANAVVPEMHRQAVEVAGWMTDRQFADCSPSPRSRPARTSSW